MIPRPALTIGLPQRHTLAFVAIGLLDAEGGTIGADRRCTYWRRVVRQTSILKRRSWSWLVPGPQTGVYRMKKILALAVIGLSLGACNSPGERAVGGAALGGLTGAAIGGLATGRAGGALAGAAIGAAGGAIIGAATTPSGGGRCPRGTYLASDGYCYRY